MAERYSGNPFTSGEPWEKVPVRVPPRVVSEATSRFEEWGAIPSGTGFGMADYSGHEPKLTEDLQSGDVGFTKTATHLGELRTATPKRVKGRSSAR